MKSLNKIILLCVVVPIFSACSDFLDVKDESAINPAIWDSYKSSTLYVNNVYNACMPTFGGDNITGTLTSSGLSDEAVGSDTPDMLLGSLNLGSVSAFSALNYQAIRYINIGLNNMKNSALRGEERNNILGQFYFFRAFQHWKMIVMHGGVPYMKDVVGYDSSDDLLNAKRNTTSECIQFIKEDLNLAMEYLPSKWLGADAGRVTKASAAAFLGRVLTFYASPQFNPTQDIERWEDAYRANLKADSICLADGVKLMDITTPQTSSWPVATDLNKIFTTENNVEVLLVRKYTVTGENSTHKYEQSVRPENLTGTKQIPSNLPSWNLVAAFPMNDGSVYTGDRKDIDYWKDRDPRFYSTIVYNGCTYLGARQWTYSSGESTSYATSTGFYCRKMVNPEITTLDKTPTDWVEMRYAEVLLNLAECAIMTNNKEKGYDCLKQLRKRAGIAAGVDGSYGITSYEAAGYTPIEIVMNERFIELAFENKRFYDLRRWNMFSSDLGPKTPKFNGQYMSGWKSKVSFNTLNPDKISITKFKEIRDEISMDDLSKYMKIAQAAIPPKAMPINYLCVPTEEELRATTAGNYNFFDIPDGILTRSLAVKQNYGWPRGEFNPFE